MIIYLDHLIIITHLTTYRKRRIRNTAAYYFEASSIPHIRETLSGQFTIGKRDSTTDP